MSGANRLLLFGTLLVSGWLVYLLGPVLTPFLASAILAYMGDPLVDRLERHRIGRSWAVAMVLFLTLIVLAVILLLLIPLVIHELAALISRLPALADWAQSAALPWLKSHLGIDIASLESDQLRATLGAHASQAGQMIAEALRSVGRSGRAIFAWLANVVLVPVVTFYLLRDWDRLVARIRLALPRRHEATVVRLAKECNEVLGAFFRGQFLVMISLGILYSAGLLLAGLKEAVAIGMIAGLMSFVPYLGLITGVVIAGLAALLQGADPWLIARVAVAFAVGQLAESLVLTPRLVGRRVGLHPVTVIFAVMAGGQLFGFVGVLLALPLTSALMVLARFGWDRYRQSRLYAGDGAA